MDTGLRDRVVLVTGASGGIGQATARLCAAEGARLVLHHHTAADAASRLGDELPVDTLPVRADVRLEGDVEAMFRVAVDTLGRVDAVVVNAGVWPEATVPLHELSLARWQDTIDVDLTGAFLTCRAFLRHLAEAPREEAVIVLVGSTAAIFGEADHADYAAAKAGLVYGLTSSLKNEIVRLAPRGRVNAVCPGWTDTPMAASGTSDPAAMERALATAPLRGIATPEDIARAIVYLLSPALSRHVTGAILPVAGGMEGRVQRE